MHGGHHVLAADDDPRVLGRAQRDVQHRALLADIDLVTAEHCVDARAQAGFLGEPQQQRERLVGDAVLRVVEVETGGLGSEALAALRILGEERAEVERADLLVVGVERLPGRSCGERNGRHRDSLSIAPGPRY